MRKQQSQCRPKAGTETEFCDTKANAVRKGQKRDMDGLAFGRMF
jgi:hypothetical protein